MNKMAKPLISSPLCCFVNEMHQAGFDVEFEKPETIEDLLVRDDTEPLNTLSSNSKDEIQDYLKKIKADGAVVIEETEGKDSDQYENHHRMYDFGLTIIPYRLKPKQIRS